MARPFSIDLRERVVDAVVRDGMSCRQAAARFGVGVSTSIAWVARFRGARLRGQEQTGAAAKMEDGFAEIVQRLQPASGLFDLAKAMLRDAWDMRLAAAHGTKDALRMQLVDVERQIENLLDRVVESASPSIVAAYEKRIEKLEREKIVLSERAASTVPPKGRLENCIELALRLLPNPWSINEKGGYVMRQTVLRLAFAEPLRTAKMACMEPRTFRSRSNT